MNESQSWEIILPPNSDKENTAQPDFLDTVSLGGVIYEAAAWYGKIKQGNQTGQPYVSLQLKSGSLKVNVALWPKTNRKTNLDPYFKGRETIQGRRLEFSAWPIPAGQDEVQFELKIVVAPLGVAGGSVLSGEALKVQKEIGTYLKQMELVLPASPPKEPVLLRKKPEPLPERADDAALETEPEDLPF
jgi:hypothetical protein